MNRKERRAAASQGAVAPSAFGSTPSAPDELFSAAERHYAEGRLGQAQSLCQRILERNPAHARSANLAGIIAHAARRYNAAVKLLSNAVALDGRDATYHFNLARSHEALSHWDKAVAHFSQAIVLGLSDVEAAIKESPVIAACLRRMTETWPRRLTIDELFGPAGVATVARDALLWSALRSHTICDFGLERFFTAVRFALLRFVTRTTPCPSVDEWVLGFVCGLARQCFLNEYVFVVGDDELVQARRLHDAVAETLNADAEISELSLATVATYFPLHRTPMAQALVDRSWSDALTGLLTLQVREPLEEARDRASIPAVTAIDDAVSLQVQRQYDANPYPRWHAVPVAPTTLDDYIRQRLPSTSFRSLGKTALDILVAGCGSGSHSIETGHRYPHSRVLAVDLSLSSLAYARRKTREFGLSNIEYAHGDILKLGSLGRTFDLIEAIGVLHHLADPMAGWRVLVSLLRPGGLMLIALYSELARRSVTAARAFIAEKGYQPTVQDIRACRQELILRGQAAGLAFPDFFTVSGCRDLLFNVMEHRLSIPQIKTFLAENGLAFLGFDVRPQIRQQFQHEFPDPAAASDLDKWHEFEIGHPRTFAGMYVFWVQNADRPPSRSGETE
jgi:SAM-dependent methyltransferase/tetratricopeptide (TPR) repeat protein